MKVKIILILVFTAIWGLTRAQFVLVPRDYANINDAIQNAGTGTSVFVAPGVYDRSTQTFPIVMRDRVSLVGSGIYNTFIDASGSGVTTATVVIQDAISTGTALAGFTIRGGTSILGGAILIKDSQLTLVYDNRLMGNSATMDGGGIYIIDSSIYVYDNIIEGNSALRGGGIYVEGAASELKILRNVVRGNQAQRGGGIAVVAAQGADIFSNTFRGNTATGFGGGFYLEQSDCIIDGNEVERNGAGYGGGFYLSSDSSGVGKNRVRLNSATAGGGMYLDGCDGTVYANEIARNTASLGSAAVFSIYGNESQLNNNIWGNRGGVGQTVELRKCVDVRFVNNTVARNEVTTSSLSGAVGFLSGTLRFYNNIIALNLGIGYVEGDAASDAEFYNNLLWENAGGSYLDEGTTLYDTGSDINAFVTNAGDNLTSDPEFVNVTFNDYHILPTSAAREHGYWFAPDRPVEDFDGDFRPPHAAADPNVDIGMDEFNRPTLACPPLFFDLDGSEDVSAGDMLVLLFDRPVTVHPPLATSDFFLPVSGDSLGSALVAEANADNAREIRLYLDAGAQFTVKGEFSFDKLGVGEASGMDLSPWVRSDAIVDRWGFGAVHRGTVGTTDSALDIKFSIDKASLDLFKYSGGILQAGTEGLLENPQIMIPFSSLIADATITLRPPYAAFRTITTAVFESTTINTIFEPERPATLSLEYYAPELDIEGGERVENLRIHQGFETAPGVYRWDVVEDAFGGYQRFDSEKNLVSVSVNWLLPRTGLGAGATMKEGGGGGAARVEVESPSNGIYALLPLDVLKENSVIIAEDAPSSPPSTVVLSVGAGGGYTKHRIEIPGYHEAASGVRVVLRRARAIERTGFPSDSNAIFAVETTDSASGEPVSFTLPFNIRIEYKDENCKPWFSDVVDLENVAAFESQMRMVRYNLETQEFDFVATGTAHVEQLENTVTAEGVSGLTSRGIGVWGAAACPQIVAENTFEQDVEYWGFGPSYAVFNLPQSGVGAGAIWLTTLGYDTFGFWYSPEDAYPVVENCLYRGTFRISTDVADPQRVPGFRMRFTPQNLEESAYLIIASAGGGESSPSPSAGTDYLLYYVPPESALDVDEDKDDFSAAFDVVHFDPADESVATLRRENFRLDRIPFDELPVFGLVRSYDFEGSTETWSFGGASPTFTLPIGSHTGGTLRLQAADWNTFGFWTATSDVVLETGRLYRAVYRVKSDSSDYQMCPEMRLRMGGSNQQFTSCVSVASVGDAEMSPNRNYRDYAVYLYPPQEGVAGGSTRLILAFDLLNFDSQDDPAGTLILDRVDVYSASVLGLP
jgi:hypothetical protein